MSTATLQQLGQDLPAWVALARRGESVAITEQGQVVARLLPPDERSTTNAATAAPVQWPNFAARRRAIFGDAVHPAGTAQALIDEDRGE